MRLAVNIMTGMQLARGGQLPFDVCDAVAMSAEEAEMMQTDINVERVIAEAMAEARRQ